MAVKTDPCLAFSLIKIIYDLLLWTSDRGSAGTLTVFSHTGNHPVLPQTTLLLAVAWKYHERDRRDHSEFQPPHFTQCCYYLETALGDGLSELRTSSLFRVQSMAWSFYTLQASFVKWGHDACFSEILGGLHATVTVEMPGAVLTFVVSHHHGEDTEGSFIYYIPRVLNYFSEFLGF